MEKININTGETTLEIMPFSLSVEIALESTNVSELYDMMQEGAIGYLNLS